MKHFLQKSFFLVLVCLLTYNIRSQSINQLNTLVSNGNSTAMYQLGMDYLSGLDSIQQNVVKGFSLIKQSAEKGYPIAQYRLAECYRQGIGVSQDISQYLKWLNNSAEKGHVDALNDLGRLYRYGKKVKQNQQEALRLFGLGVQQDNIKSQLFLGEMILRGEGTGKDYQKAFNLFTQSANQGNALAMVHIGTMYKEALGVNQNYQEAVKWFIKSATAGNEEGMYMLAYMYYKGFGIEQNYQKTIYWAQKSAMFHSYNGAFLLGYCYKEGFGTPVDTLQAIHYLLRADTSQKYQAKIALQDIMQKKCYVLSNAKSMDSLNIYLPKTYSHTKSVSSNIKLDGYWSGKMYLYDWSGTRIIGEYPVKFEAINKIGMIVGSWIISDSIKISGNAAITNNKIDFSGMNFAKSDWYCYGLSKWEITGGQFELKGTNNNFLVGNLTLHSDMLNEDGNPTYVVLKRTAQKSEIEDTSLLNPTKNIEVNVYPNPFTNWLNINYQVQTAGTVRIELLDQSQLVVCVISEKNLTPGVYTETYINSGLMDKTYILRITQNNSVITKTIIKL